MRQAKPISRGSVNKEGNSRIQNELAIELISDANAKLNGSSGQYLINKCTKQKSDISVKSPLYRLTFIHLKNADFFSETLMK